MHFVHDAPSCATGYDIELLLSFVFDLVCLDGTGDHLGLNRQKYVLQMDVTESS